MTERPPSEHDPRKVPGHPAWEWWVGVNGMLYARRPKTSPPKLARAHEWPVLLREISAAETGNRE